MHHRFEPGNIKLAAAVLVAVVGVGAAVWSVTATRGTRDLSVRPTGPASPSTAAASGGLSPANTADAPEPESPPADEPANPRRYASVASSEKLSEVSQQAGAAVGEFLTQTPSIEGVNLSASDQQELAARTAPLLRKILGHTPEEIEAAVRELGGRTEVGPDGKPAQKKSAGNLAAILKDARLDLANITVGRPVSGAPMMSAAGPGPNATPGSGAFRVARDADGNPVPTPTAGNAPSGMTLPLGSTPTNVKTRSIGTAVIRTKESGTFPDVDDYETKKLPAVALNIPARLDDEDGPPDLNLELTMAKSAAGLWQPAGLSMQIKNPAVMQKLMSGMRANIGTSAPPR